FFPGTYLARSYTILTADNRRTGRFEDLETFGLPRNFRARLDYFNNSVELNLRAQLIGDGASVFQPIALPPIPGLPSIPEDPPGPAPPTSTSNHLSVRPALPIYFPTGAASPRPFVSLYPFHSSTVVPGDPETCAERRPVPQHEVCRSACAGPMWV